MSTLAEIWDSLESLDLREVVADAIEEQKQQYVKMNLEQLYQGLNPDGGKIEPKYRSRKYASAKADMNPAPGEGTPDFYLTGSLYEQTEAEVQGDELVIGSPVDYMAQLEGRWGPEELWGLTEENHEEFVHQDLAPLIIERVSELTGMT